jgi:glycosyltransferase involved in cell wall biosynthesis
MTEIGVYLGTSDGFVGQIFNRQPWAECLSAYDTTAFGSATVSDSLQDRLTIYETTGHGPTSNPIEKIRVTYRDTIEYIDAHDPDILLQLMKYTTHAPGVALAAWRRNLPCITRLSGEVFTSYEHHNFPWSAAVFGLTNVLGRIPVLLSTKMIALGPSLRDQLVARGMDSQDVEIIPPVIDLPEQFHPVHETARYRDALSLPEDRTVVLTVGRVTRMKGMKFLSNLIKEVAEDINATFVVVGDGPYREILKDRFSETVLRVVGEVPHSEIDQYYKAADVYVHSSPHEGISLAVLEAQECGTPVLVRRAGDMSFATDNIVDTPEEMAERLRSRQYSAARPHPHQFTKNYMWTTFESLLDDCLDN